MKRLRLTKKWLAALDIALSLDDVLFEKFRRLHEELDREQRKLDQTKQIINVYQKRGNYYHTLKILDVRVGPKGTDVTVL